MNDLHDGLLSIVGSMLSIIRITEVFKLRNQTLVKLETIGYCVVLLED